mgnify:CR=1 FL=1
MKCPVSFFYFDNYFDIRFYGLYLTSRRVRECEMVELKGVQELVDKSSKDKK